MDQDLIKVIMKCVNFAAVKHKDQRRLDREQTPYINHPLGVAYILTEAGVIDPVTIQAAILHDTVEDTDTTFDELEEIFGKVVSDVVREVTDDKTLPKQVRKDLQIEHAAGSSDHAKLVKLADKIYNLKDLERSSPVGWSEARVREYFKWSRRVVEKMRGLNPGLDSALDEIFERNKIFE